MLTHSVKRTLVIFERTDTYRCSGEQPKLVSVTTQLRYWVSTYEKYKLSPLEQRKFMCF